MNEEETTKKKKESYEKILKALEEAPIYEGFTAKELSKEIDMPEPTARWYLEVLEGAGKIRSRYVGKTRLYRKSKEKQ